LGPKDMKRTGLTLALLLLAGGLLADPLFCCALPADEHPTSFSAPAMDCCTSGEERGCGPKLERAATLRLDPVASTTFVLAAAPALPDSPQVSVPGSPVLGASAVVERPPRLHLLHSQFRI
jgi:hypothetical protein